MRYGRFFIPFVITMLLACGFPGCSLRQNDLDRAVALERDGKIETALSVYRLELAHSSDRRRQAEIEVHVGDCLLRLGRVPEAFSAFQRASELDEHNTKAHQRLGELYLASGDADRASLQASALLHSGSISVDGLNLLGSAAAAAGHSSVAEESFRRVLELEPGRLPTAMSLAEIYLASNRPDEARALLSRAAQAQPASGAPWLALARLEEQESRPQEAEEDYRRAIAVEDSAETNLRLAQFLQRKARVSEVGAVLARVDQLRPVLPVASADFAFATQHADDAATRYLAALNSQLGQSRKGIAQQARLRGQLAARLVESELALAQKLKTSPEKKQSAQTALNLARTYITKFSSSFDPATLYVLKAELDLSSDNLPQAAEDVNEALRRVPESVAAHYVSGLVKVRTGDVATAQREWEWAVAHDEDSIPARLGLASLALSSGDLKSALAYSAQVVRAEPSNLGALLVFARTLAKLRRYPDVEMILERVQALAPDSPEPDVIRGEVALERRQPAASLLHFKKALILDAQSEMAVSGLVRVYRTGSVSRPMLMQVEKTALAPPVSPALLEIAGRLYADHGWIADAIRCLSHSVEIDSSRDSAARFLAMLHVRKGDESAATAAASRIHELAPLLKAFDDEQKNDLSTAISDYEMAVRIGDPTGVAANNLAWIYASRGTNLDRALKLAEFALDAQPTNPAVLDTIGFVYLSRREFSNAVVVLQRAQRLAAGQGSEGKDTMAAVRRHLEEAYLNAGQSEEAASLRAPQAIPGQH